MAKQPYHQHGSQIWRHNRLVATIPHDGSMLDVAKAVETAAEIVNQLNAVALLKTTLQRIAAMDATNSQAAILAKSEAREALQIAGFEP